MENDIDLTSSEHFKRLSRSIFWHGVIFYSCQHSVALDATCVIMEVERPAISPSRASSTSTDYSEFSVFKHSLRKKLDLWVGDVPSQDDSSFQCLIQRELTETPTILLRL